MFDQYFLPTSDFIPEYQGLPLAQMEASANRLEDTYTRNLSTSTQLDLLNADRKAVTGDEDLSTRVGTEYAGVIDQLAKEGDYENMTPRLSALVSKYSRDPRLKAIAESRENFDKEQELIQQMKARGETPLFTGDTSKHRSYDSETGKFNIYRPSVETMMDYDDRRAKIWDELKADQWIGDLSEAEKKTLGAITEQYLNYGVAEGITGSKITKQLDNVMNSYKSTKEYDQEKRKITAENPGIAPEAVEAQIRAKVLDRGELKQYLKRDVQSLKNEDYGAEGGNGFPLGPGYEEMSGTDLNADVGYKADDFVVKDRSKAVINEDAFMAEGYAQAIKSKKWKGIADTVTPEQQQAFDNGVQAGVEMFSPGLESSTLSHEQKIEYARNYENVVKQRMVNYKINTTDFSREYQEYNIKPTDVTQTDLLGRVEDSMLRQLESRSFYDPSTGKVFTMKDRKGKTSEEFNDYIGDPKNIVLSGAIDPKHYFTKNTNNPEFADAYVINVRDPDNKKTRQLLVTRSDSSRNNDLGMRAKYINDVYTTFSVRPNQVFKTALAIPGMGEVQLTGRKKAMMNNAGGLQELGLEVSIDGSNPLQFGSEEQLVDFIMRQAYGR